MVAAALLLLLLLQRRDAGERISEHVKCAHIACVFVCVCTGICADWCVRYIRPV